MIWAVAATAVIAAARGAARQKAVRIARLERRTAAHVAAAARAAARTVAGIVADYTDVSRADLGHAAHHLRALAELKTRLSALDAPAREAVDADLESLERALAEKLEDVDRGFATVAAVQAKLPARS